MRLWGNFAATCSLAISLALWASTATAELKVGGFMDDWSPRFCVQPSPPFFSSSRGRAEEDINKYNSYITDVQSFMACIDGEAQDDYKKAKSVIERKLSQIKQDVMNSVTISKSQLEMSYRLK